MTAEGELTALYQEILLGHYRSPRHRGTLPPPRRAARVRNPSCGDEVTIHLRLAGDRVEAIRFEGEGCSISQASASMMTATLEGRTVQEARAVAARFVDLLQGDQGAAADPILGDLRALAEVARFPIRVRCARLAFEAFEEALRASPGEATPDASSALSAPVPSEENR